MRTRLLPGALAAVALILPVASAPAQQRRPAVPAARDWSRTVAPTAEGGFRMGNPDAPVKIVEYLSLTCPHCAHFAEQGAPRLIRDYVRSGRASLEYRNFVLNAYDVAATMISRCAAPENYFALNHAIFASQSQWVGRIQSMSAEQRRQLQDQPPLTSVQRIVAATGLDAIAARHGVTPARARACLSSQAGLDRIMAMLQAGERAGVQGTPSFAINGRLAGNASDWASLEPLLRATQ